MIVLKKRFLIRIVSYFSVAVFIAIGFWRVEYLKTKKYQQIIENRYAEALSELSSGLNQISLLLEKAGYTTTPSLYSGLATELYSVAELSKNSLSVLPHGDTSLDTINRFLSQVGNFSLSVSEKMINEQEIDEITLKNLSELSDTAETIRQAVMDTDLTYNNSQYWAEEIESQLKNKVLDKSLANSLTELEQNLSDYPTLIYDGPFSDHILTQKPLMITGQPTVNKDEAKTKAEKFCKTGKQVLQYTGMEEGKIPTFRFEGKSKIVTVTKEGGEILYFRDTRAIDKYVLTIHISEGVNFDIINCKKSHEYF